MINMRDVVFGLTGAFGSGCSFLADYFFKDEFHFKKYSLSESLKSEFYKKFNRNSENRNELQDFGDKIRLENKYALAQKVFEQIENGEGLSQDQPVIIDSIRNPSEIKFFRNNYSNFILIGVYSDYDIRWKRVKEVYHNKKDEFDRDEIRDQGIYEPDNGQKISDCFFEADLIIINNKFINYNSPNTEYNEMLLELRNYIKAFKDPTSSHPTIKESLMAIAYTTGRRSTCRKRRVGAVIADKYNNILSTGYNNVPNGLNDCSGQYGDCYRTLYRKNMLQKIKSIEMTHGIDQTKSIAREVIKNFKVLEICRSLHAEENAILNLVSNSNLQDYSDCKLYTTTYPCNLCANKIVQIGIKKVIFFQPYPVEDAKRIFDEAKVKTEPFEGITFRAFFRAFNFNP